MAAPFVHLEVLGPRAGLDRWLAVLQDHGGCHLADALTGLEGEAGIARPRSHPGGGARRRAPQRGRPLAARDRTFPAAVCRSARIPGRGPRGRSARAARTRSTSRRSGTKPAPSGRGSVSDSRRLARRSTSWRPVTRRLPRSTRWRPPERSAWRAACSSRRPRGRGVCCAPSAGTARGSRRPRPAAS